MLKQQNEVKKEIADLKKKNDPNSIITESIPGLKAAIEQKLLKMELLT